MKTKKFANSIRQLLRLQRLLQLVFIAAFLQSAHAVPNEGHQTMVAAPSPYAVETAKHILKNGGNVIDVAVAMGLTLTVTSPYYASLGGGGFAVLRMQKQTWAVDFREMAPLALNEKTFATLPKEASRKGGLAIGVPGFPAGLFEMHKRFGKLKWSALFEDALTLAEKGFELSGEWVKNTERERDIFVKAGHTLFFKANDVSYEPGEILKQPLLAKALKLFRDKNIHGFYEGSVAADLAQSVQEAKGVMTTDDLKKYKVRWLKPLETNFRGYKLFLMPPPSSGGAVIKTALWLTEALKVTDKKPLGVDEFHLLGEILSRSFRERTLLGDPDFVKNPLTSIEQESYLQGLKNSISETKTSTLEPLKEDAFEEKASKKESTETTHFSVLDHEGNAIALTVTLNGNYGSGVVSKKFGIALNDEIDDFTTKLDQANMFRLTQGARNLVQGGKRPLSSMSPTLVEKDGQIVMSIGAPGGPRIISGVFQGLYRVLARGMNMDQAVQAPRVHHQFSPNKLFIERERFAPEVVEGLKKLGHEIEETDGVARVCGVRKNEKGRLEAAFDSRGEGAAGGY